MRGTKNTKQSMSVYLKRLVLVLVPLFVIYISVSVLSTFYFKKQVVTYGKTFVDFYIDQIETTVSNINYRMSMFVLGENETGENLNSYIKAIKTTDNLAFRDYYSNKLRDVFLMYSMEYGKEYQFFAFFPETGSFIGANTNDRMGQEVWNVYTRDICGRLEKNSLTPNSGTSYWQLVGSRDEESYILKLYFVEHMYVGCWIRPEDLAWPLYNAIEGGKTAVALYDDNNTVIFGQEPETALGITIERRLKNLPFTINMTISDYGIFQKTLIIHLSLALMGFGMLCGIVSVIYLLYRRILRPMIHGLQKEIYEGEIKKQMMDMEYLKLQIEPHFYLNCLNFIYNMIDLSQYAQAAAMASMTANYMRYLFNHSRELVFIWEELEHVRHYMDIQKLRFEGAFDYYIEQEPETRDVKILPLLIQTFVENCIKYAMNLDSKLCLTVTVFSEEMDGKAYINICIMDNGPGFSGELLEQLEDKGAYVAGESTHVGIANALKRLRYTYKDEVSINFYNGPVKGAVVDIHIPSCLPDRREEVRK